MRVTSFFSTIVFLTLSATGAGAPPQEPAITVHQLTEHLFQLTTDQGAYTTTTLASVGPDGVLLVDTQHRNDSADLKRVVESFGKGPPKFIINTHRHVEHVGGNSLWGDTPVIIAHELVRSKLRSGSYLFDEFPDSTLPDIMITAPTSIFFNGERIDLIPMPGSHDDNEVIVHFTGSKVVHLSSLANGFNFPSVDSDGNALMFEPLVAKALVMLPPGVLIVSGHNRNGTMEDLRAYHEMLVATTAAVRSGLDEGKTVEELEAEKILEPWENYAGSYVSADEWIQTLADAMSDATAKGTNRIFEPMYYSLKEGGADAAVARYRELKAGHADEYDFRDTDLLVIGNKLAEQGSAEEAIAILALALEEYPESPYVYYANYSMALAYQALGDTAKAIEYCGRAVEQSPDSQAIHNLLEELRSGAPPE